MSKMADVLKRPSSQKEIYASAQEEIARTYLKVSGKNSSKKKSPSKMPWVVAILIFVLLGAAMFVLFSKSNIDIKIRLLNNIPDFKTEGKKDEPSGLRSADKGIFFLSGPEINNDFVKDAYFAGDAKTYSRLAIDQLVLCNSRGNGWANYTLELKDPIDLNKFEIKYVARGGKGEEWLLLVLVDAANRSYRMQRDTTTKLTKDWQQYTVDARSLKNTIDVSNISIIRFEFGSLTSGNDLMATIFLKDVYAAKTKRMRWL